MQLIPGLTLVPGEPTTPCKTLVFWRNYWSMLTKKGAPGSRTPTSAPMLSRGSPASTSPPNSPLIFTRCAFVPKGKTKKAHFCRQSRNLSLIICGNQWKGSIVETRNRWIFFLNGFPIVTSSLVPRRKVWMNGSTLSQLARVFVK